MRIVFMGTPEFSVPVLMEIIGHGHEVVAVYSQPPRPAGRGMEERKSPVHIQAEAFDIPVYTPKSLKGTAEQIEFAALNADVAVVVAYGLLLPQAILDAPANGCLNLHASLLPRWRGAAPIQRAIMAGDSQTGVEVMRMDAGLDTGDICLAERLDIAPDVTAGDLHDQLCVLGADLIGRALAALSRGSLDGVAQSEDGVEYAAKIDKAEARINFDRPAIEVHNHIRGLSPFPGAWLEMLIKGKKQRVKLLRSKMIDDVSGALPGTVLTDDLVIACKDGAVKLVELQRAGKGPMRSADFQRGANIAIGTVIGNPDQVNETL